MKVYEAIANAFVKEGTSTVFGLLGGGQVNWWSSMVKFPSVKMIDVRDEGAALAMAEGWAMATGKTAVCSVTQGPGITRMATSLVCATRTSTPIVVYTSKTPFNNKGSAQFLDQDRFVSATGAGYIEILTPSFAESAVRQAFYQAKLELRPVVLCVPHDLQNKECESDGDDYQTSASMFPHRQRIRPDLERLQAAMEMIKAAKKPVVVIGRGAMNPAALKAIDNLAKRTGALICTTLLAQGMLSESEYHAGISGLFSTRTVMQLFKEADCVIAFGAGLNARTIEGGYLYPDARIIHVDLQPHLMMGNDRGADCFIQGDAAATAEELDALLAKQSVSKEGFRTKAVRDALRNKDHDPAEFEIEPNTVDPREAVKILDERLPMNAALVQASPGHSFSFPILGMKKARPLYFIRGFGSIGQTLPAAIGVAVARPGEPVVHLEGDGGAMQNLQELDTAARLKLKLLFIVLNDQAYGAEYHLMKAKGYDAELSTVPSPDFGAVGRVLGCRGRMATKLEEVTAAVDEFLGGEGPMVLDLRISRNVVSIPYRRLHYGQDA